MKRTCLPASRSARATRSTVMISRKLPMWTTPEGVIPAATVISSASGWAAIVRAAAKSAQCEKYGSGLGISALVGPEACGITCYESTRMTRVRLSKALERAIGSGHPWIYRDALAGRLPAPGEIVTVLDRKGRFLARGLAERGPIGVRVFTTVDRPLDRSLIDARIDAALTLRRQLAPPETDAVRLIHGEGDRLPGVVVDRYAEFAVLKLDGDAILAWRDAIEASLRERLPALGVRSLLRRSGRGEHKQVERVFGELPEAPVEIREHGMRLLVDLLHGQKTGMFLNHRPNRLRTRELIGNLVASGAAPEV